MSTAQRRILTADCMACNLEHGQPMRELCSDLEDAEERASDHEPQRGNDDDD